jgi:4-hydroxy-3-polyprenylbenzoate decarboxylase
VRLLEVLGDLGIRTELIISEWAETTIRLETGRTVDDVRSLATVNYSESNQAAPISSGSHRVDGMAVVPCSMKTLAAIAHGMGESLIPRAADVMIKERKPLLVAPREMPLSAIHLENMLKLARNGVIVMPPMPAFYNRPTSIDELVDHFVARALDQFGVDAGLMKRWGSARPDPDSK